ncbi:hypothetical protein VIGAN_11036900 [Vigna angularis var. angularis]|uniref:Uncharacterized protein n=1 Tax=Vigna angularis var. angularis TaxID=157739 RepID=A0A0S3T8C4_PHAAN|nr:hypothetical protein VIGAN_11036900 [Vigna angularis var. angularis]
MRQLINRESGPQARYVLLTFNSYSQILNSDNHSLNIQPRVEALQITRLTWASEHLLQVPPPPVQGDNRTASKVQSSSKCNSSFGKHIESQSTLGTPLCIFFSKISSRLKL